MQIPHSLRHRQFALFWGGLFFSWVGNYMLITAIPWHIHTFSDNPIALGSIGLIKFAPLLLGSLFAGFVADSFSRRRVVFLTQGLMGLTALLAGLLTLSGRAQLWHIYLLLALYSTAFVFDAPARYSLTPNLVPERLLPNAISVEMISLQIGGLIGPVMGGWIIEHYGQEYAYLTSGVFFAFMTLTLLTMGSVSQQKVSTQHRGDWEASGRGYASPCAIP